jgi:hypothetical protein
MIGFKMLLLMLPLTMVALNHPTRRTRKLTVDMIEDIGKKVEDGDMTMREAMIMLKNFKPFNGSITTLGALELIVNYRMIRERCNAICCLKVRQRMYMIGWLSKDRLTQPTVDFIVKLFKEHHHIPFRGYCVI